MKDFLINIIPIFPIILAILIGTRKRKPWNELSPQEKKQQMILIILGVVFFIAGVIVAFIY